MSTLPLASRSAAGFQLGLVGVLCQAAPMAEASIMSTVPLWSMSGSLDTIQLAVPVTMMRQSTVRVKGATGTARSSLVLMLELKDRVIVKFFDRIVTPEVLFTTLTEAVPVSVPVVALTLRLIELVMVTPSKLTVVLRLIVAPGSAVTAP